MMHLCHISQRCPSICLDVSGRSLDVYDWQKL
jgi:hypothetical protein